MLTGSPRSDRRPHRFEAAGLSDRGEARSRNEDALAIARELGLFLVADGMGGAAAGEVAAHLAVDTVRAAMAEASGDGVARLITAIQRANARVYAEARADHAKDGMGTTLAALLLLPRGAVVAHVGDSRVYRLRGGRLERLTEDHSLVAERVRAGVLTPEEGRRSPQRHILSRALGPHEQVVVDWRRVEVEAGDVFLLSTDGLHGVVGEEEIAAIVAAQPDVGRAATYLIDAAYEREAPDNVTVVVVRIGEEGSRGG